MSTGKVLLGVAAGVAAGALLGVLFAPDKGTNTRKKICREGKDLTNDLKDKFDEILESITEKFSKVKKDATDFAEKRTNKEEKAEEDLKAAKQ